MKPLNVVIEKETSCGECIHEKVCARDMEKRCSNYWFGRSDEPVGCDQCTRKYTRWTRSEKDHVPCFHCAEFLKK